MPFKYVAAFAAVLSVVSIGSSSLPAQQTGMPGMPGMPMPDITKKPSTAKPQAKPGKATPKKAPAKDTPHAAADHAARHATMPARDVMQANSMMAGPLGIPMDRMGSGTTWIPDAISLPSRHKTVGQWDLMAHGFVFGEYDKQGGKRGDDQLGSLNWAMLMASRKIGGGQFQARTMLSLDPITVTSRGYPLLLQSGETYKGQALHDRQHPHDFFMELGALYQREINKELAWSIYAAPSGEPALGPVAFMHRPSAMDNPTAPLGHHWQDATHVSFGVITAGLMARRWQLESSVFNGREPDENRWNFDPIKLDSYSGRVTFNPTENWSMTVGMGYMKSPEALHPDESMHRITGSILHGRKIGVDGQTASALIIGMNRHGTSQATHSVLFENESILDSKNTIFGRTEFVQKTGEDLALGEAQSADRFNVGAAQLGYIREVVRLHWATVGIGAAGTLNFVPAPLESTYGSRNPMGALVFVRLRPVHLSMDSMQHMAGMTPH